MQQVNLFVEELRPRKDYFTALNVGLALCIFVALSIIYSGLQYREVAKIEETVLVRKTELDTLNKTVALLKKKTEQNNRKSLEKEVTKLHKVLDTKQRLVKAFNGQTLGNKKGFSPLLIGLASQSDDSIALEQFRLLKGGLVTEIKGTSAHPESVFEYLDRLIKLNAFNKAQFGLIEINDSHSSLIHFASGTLVQGKSDDKNKIVAFNRGSR